MRPLVAHPLGGRIDPRACPPSAACRCASSVGNSPERLSSHVQRPDHGHLCRNPRRSSAVPSQSPALSDTCAVNSADPSAMIHGPVRQPVQARFSRGYHAQGLPATTSKIDMLEMQHSPAWNPHTPPSSSAADHRRTVTSVWALRRTSKPDFNAPLCQCLPAFVAWRGGWRNAIGSVRILGLGKKRGEMRMNANQCLLGNIEYRKKHAAIDNRHAA